MWNLFGKSKNTANTLYEAHYADELNIDREFKILREKYPDYNLVQVNDNEYILTHKRLDALGSAMVFSLLSFSVKRKGIEYNTVLYTIAPGMFEKKEEIESSEIFEYRAKLAFNRFITEKVMTKSSKYPRCVN